MSRLKLSSVFKSAVAMLAVVSSTAFAAPVNIAGELTTSDPTYNRPFGLTTLSSVGTNVRYDVYGFYVTAAGTYSMEATTFSENSSDTFFALYKDAFDPRAALSNLLAVDDDSGAGLLSLITTVLQANVQYYLVLSGFGNGMLGTYTGVFDSVSGTGQVVLANAPAPGEVPEPATLALLFAAAAGMTLVRRRRA